MSKKKIGKNLTEKDEKILSFFYNKVLKDNSETVRYIKFKEQTRKKQEKKHIPKKRKKKKKKH